jgi:kynureninase
VTRGELEALDRADPLRDFRARFELPEGLIYLDGNSLGALPARTRERLRSAVEDEWAKGLIRSWDDAGWISMPQRIGDKIARLVGARPGEVVAADSTSVNLFKALSVALRERPGRRWILSERGNFPTDLYVAQGLARQLSAGHELLLVEDGDAGLGRELARRGGEIATVMLTHVDYRSGRIHDMARLTSAARDAGAIAIWDLSHSAGALPVDLGACGVELAVGCGYKFLNGGPGAPAFLYVARALHESAVQPLSGWMGHANPFAFAERYEPAPGIARFLCGTPAVLAMAALECGVDLMLEAPMEAIRRKSLALGEAFIDSVDTLCAGRGLALVSPRAGRERASQVTYAHPRAAGIMRALAARGVIGDHRPPDLLRFGLAPLYVRYVDAWDAAVALGAILDTAR